MRDRGIIVPTTWFSLWINILPIGFCLKPFEPFSLIIELCVLHWLITKTSRCNSGRNIFWWITSRGQILEVNPGLVYIRALAIWTASSESKISNEITSTLNNEGKNDLALKLSYYGNSGLIVGFNALGEFYEDIAKSQSIGDKNNLIRSIIIMMQMVLRRFQNTFELLL